MSPEAAIQLVVGVVLALLGFSLKANFRALTETLKELAADVKELTQVTTLHSAQNARLEAKVERLEADIQRLYK